MSAHEGKAAVAHSRAAWSSRIVSG